MGYPERQCPGGQMLFILLLACTGDN
ncbi:MAG: hypothetical protein ACI8S6_005713, partial [Myxococcota bacterium]